MFPDASCGYRRVPVTCTNETVDGSRKYRAGEGNKEIRILCLALKQNRSKDGWIKRVKDQLKKEGWTNEDLSPSSRKI